MYDQCSGGCDHIHTHTKHAPIDNHTCHCSVCKSVTGQDTTHVVFYNHANNPDGPLELCTCGTCGAPIMLDDKQHRIRVIVPNLMGYGDKIASASYHAFYDPATGVPKPDDGRPVYPALRPDFVWPPSS